MCSNRASISSKSRSRPKRSRVEYERYWIREGPLTHPHEVTTDWAELSWEPTPRVAVIRYVHGANLSGKAGRELGAVLTDWVGSTTDPFAVLAEATGLAGTDAEYRAAASHFFRQHRGSAVIAVIKPGPIIQIVVEMFRIATGLQLKTFSAEPEARAWLRSKGIRA